MEGPAPFGRFAYGGVDKMAGRVVAANAQGLMVRTFPCHVGTNMSRACDITGTRLLERVYIAWLVCSYRVVRIGILVGQSLPKGYG